MSDRLIGCRIKLDRALHHLEILNKEIEGFKKPQVNRIPGYFDPDTSLYIFRREGRPVPKREWSAVIGHAVHNLSACLDYLAWELVEFHSPGSGNSRTAFPIYLKESAYNSGAPEKVSGMAPRAEAVILGLQPFKDSPRDRHPSENPLWVLRELEIRDKHRSLTLTAQIARWHWEGLPPGVMVVDPSFLHEEDTATVVSLNPGDNPERYVGVHFVTESDICFAPGGPSEHNSVITTITEIADYIARKVIPSLQGFLA